MATPDVDVPTREEEDSIAGLYVVVLDENEDLDSHLDWVKEQSNENLDSDSECTLVHEHKIINGYNAKLRGSAVDLVAERKGVKFVIKEQLAYLDAEPDAGGGININVANDAPWNLNRLSHSQGLPPNADPLALNYNYRYQDGVQSKPVNAYVLDTGVKLDHEVFQGRASSGPNFSKDPDGGDNQGHGTHVAGTIGGNRVGVARNVNIISLKVVGGAAIAGTLAAIRWARTHAQTSGNPSIINMSLRFVPPVDQLDQAVNDAVADGVHVVVSAGNNNRDATSQSPARAANVLAVGASTIEDRMWTNPNDRSSGSNFGPRVGIFAPGHRIMSAGIQSKTELVAKTGTSMATPLVAGTIAYLIQTEGNKTPAAMVARLRELAINNQLQGLPANTVNRLIRNNVP